MTLQAFRLFVNFCLLQVFSQNTAVLESRFPLVALIGIRQKKQSSYSRSGRVSGLLCAKIGGKI
jgi:hypothetical protein